MDDVRAAIDRRRLQWTRVVNAGNLDEYSDLVAVDVVWLPPRGTAIRGREAFKEWLQPFFQSFSYHFQVEPLELRVSDRWCAESGRFMSKLTPTGGGTTQEHRGAYTVLWRLDEVDGKWRIERYIDGFGGHLEKD
jgi:uncharacterized protein (TIGR02246 family)